MISIANAVGSGDLGTELDVSEVCKDLDLPYTEYDPSNYHGLYVRLVAEGPLITIYRTGKYIISGCSSFEELFDTNDEFLTELSRMNVIELPVKTGFTVQNVVCTAELPKSVDLNTLSILLGLESVEYEPEQFPGLIYRPEEFRVVFLIFANGKVVVTGATDMDTAEDAFIYLKDRVANV